MKRRPKRERLLGMARRTVFHDQVGRTIWDMWHERSTPREIVTCSAMSTAKRIEPYVRKDLGTWYLDKSVEDVIERTRWWTCG